MKHVLMIGLSTYDITVPMDGPLVENQKYRLRISAKGGGGPAFNAAYLCARWGIPTYLRTRIGCDEFGRAMRALMREAGILEDEVLQSEEFHTPYSYIFTNRQNGNRTVMNFRDDPETRHFPFADHGIGVILTDGHEKTLSLDAFRQYPDALRVLDAGNFKKYTLDVAREVDYLVSSQVFAEGYTNRKIDGNDPQSCREIFEAMEQISGKTVVITLGEEGLLYRVPEDSGSEHAGEVRRMPAFPAEAVDTTGAGDIFHGAFVYGLAQGMEFERILRLAQMTASISVRYEGSQTSVPELAAVKSALEQR
jgi:sulfofructose kinase